MLDDGTERVGLITLFPSILLIVLSISLLLDGGPDIEENEGAGNETDFKTVEESWTAHLESPGLPILTPLQLLLFKFWGLFPIGKSKRKVAQTPSPLHTGSSPPRGTFRGMLCPERAIPSTTLLISSLATYPLFEVRGKKLSAQHSAVQWSTVVYRTDHYTTLHYTTLHYTTLHYTTLQYTTLHYSIVLDSSNNTVLQMSTRFLRIMRLLENRAVIKCANDDNQIQDMT